ncbi:UNVERIFIED_CONTAM: hypothetical protein FKN15_069900 [Acipenser sinensis]
MLVSSLPKSTWMILKRSGTMFYGQMSQKWNFLADMGPVMSGENQTLHSTVRTSWGGSVIVWGCFAASGPGRLAIIEGTMNSALYQRIQQENVRPSVRELKLKHSWVMQQGNDPKHTSKSTSEWMKNKKFKVLEWPSQSPDLKPH